MDMEKKGNTNLERELSTLKQDLIKMMELVSHQMERAEQAFTSLDVPLAKEVHHMEKMVDAADLSIDKECENIIALYNPVASDLRFILAATKIISHLERVGDHADKIARYVRKKQITKTLPKSMRAAVKLDTMFDVALEMLGIATQAFIEEDTVMARKVFSKDIVMNEIYANAIDKMQVYADEKDPDVGILLYLFSVINKLERVGDMATNIAEETIFYLEAKVLKHHKVANLKNL